MSYNAIQVLIPIVGLAVNISTQIFCVRLTHGQDRLKAVVLGFASGGLSVLLSEIYLVIMNSPVEDAAVPMIITNLIIYFFLGYGYFHFVNLGETGRRVRIIRELYDAKDGLTMDGLLKKYNAGNIVEVRLQRLLNNNQIVLKNNRYYIGKPLMLMISRTITVMKMIILGNKSEFD